jgi:hypothetical protein
MMGGGEDVGKLEKEEGRGESTLRTKGVTKAGE